MKYDNIIIGGGLSGLVAGVNLAQQGRSVAIIASGQSALHFTSGSMALLGCVDGQAVERPMEGMSGLGDTHPYTKIGVDKIASLAAKARDIFTEAGIEVTGSCDKNSYRLTPMGMWEPTWLSMAELATCPHPSECEWKKAAIVNFRGYLDFFPQYVADGLNSKGIEATCHEVSIPALNRLRKSCSEMRAASIAKILTGANIAELGRRLSELEAVKQADVVLLPAVIGLKSTADIHRLAGLVKKPIRYVPVIPMSVQGVRAQALLRRRFEELGGVFLMGDSVKSGKFEGGRLKSITTVNLGESSPLEAGEYIIATGSFFSQGLVAKPDRVVEPVFGLDVEQTAERTERYDINFFAPQPYMKFGVVTDSQFRVSLGGKTVENLRAAGAILSGANALKEGSGAGIAILSALYVTSL